MKICRFNGNRLGIVEAATVADVTEALDVLPQVRWPLPLGDLLIANLPAVLERAKQLLPKAKRVPLSECRFQSPVANPSKIMGAPLNYAEHISESKVDDTLRHGHALNTADTAGLFLKASTSLIGPGEPVLQRFENRRNDHEAELAVIIGKQGTRIERARAREYIVGLCIGLDMTVRGPEFNTFRKSIDTYGVLGPWLTTLDECPDYGNIDFELSVNGVIKQKANTREMIIPVDQLIEIASQFFTLLPGDVLMTGTPAGVSPVKPGDTIDVSFAGLSSMSVKIGRS